MPRISVVIPACNEEKYIENTLRSVHQQDFWDFETIVVCNGCTDKTEEIVKNIPQTKLISLPEGHVSQARNTGAKAATGDLLLFLDADSLLDKDSLSKVAQDFTEQIAVATTKVNPDQDKFKYNLAMGFKNFYHTAGLYQGCSGALVCRKEDFDKVGGYDDIKVKEHRKLILKLKRTTGKDFACINTPITTSMRRFQKWGLTKATAFWVKEWVKNYLGDLKKSEYEKIR